MFNSCKSVYVHAPAGNATGGVELLHQLVSFLRNNGKNAFIVFCGEKKHTIHPEYLKYNIKTIEENEIENSSLNVEVYTDTTARFLFANKRKTKKLFWWLSVDYYYIVNKSRATIYDLYLFDKNLAFSEFKHRLKCLLMGENLFINNIEIKNLKNVVFAYQSEYIRNHLLKYKIKELIPLYDYINTDYLSESQYQREKIVLYNPAKGYNFTKKIIEKADDIKWLPLSGYNRNELLTIMKKAMVYIDFGNHPGKDRLPRECALNGCCVITGVRGSAGYSQDVPINMEYKFDEKKESLDKIIEKIRCCLENYDNKSKDFDIYRSKIKQEKAEFEKQVSKLFF